MFNPVEQKELLIQSVSDALNVNKDLSENYRKAVLHITVEKWLNSQYLSTLDKNISLNITLISKGSGGFGDVIWGFRAIQVIQNFLPQAKIAIISDALDKFKQLNVTEGHNTNIEFIDFKDRNAVLKNLSQCDLGIDGPYPHGPAYLSANDSEITDLIQSLRENKRLISGIEYDRGDYDSSWWEQKKPSVFLSGLGDNAYGIFLVDELIDFAKTSSILSRADKIKLIGQIKNRAVREIILAKYLNDQDRIYFGYGHHEQKEFIEVITNYEDLSEKDGDIIIVLVNAEGTGLDEQNLVDELKQNPLKNISSISTIFPFYYQSDEQIQELVKKYSKRFGLNFEDLKAKRDKIFAPGQEYIVEEKELIKFSHKRRKAFILMPGSLTTIDMMTMYKVSEAISLRTGDQSLGEGISKKDAILYDPRKVETLRWMIRLAERNQLSLIAEFMNSFTFKKDVKRVVELLKDPKLVEEKEKLLDLCQKRNLAHALQGIVSRRIFHLKTGFKGENIEDELHDLAEGVLSGHVEDNQLLEDVVTLHKNIQDLSKQF